MKGKEYLAKLHELEAEKGFDPALSDIFIMMSQEVGEIIKLRHATRNSAVLSVISEMNDRWNWMAKTEPRLRRDGFAALWDKKLQEPVQKKSDQADLVKEKLS